MQTDAPSSEVELVKQKVTEAVLEYIPVDSRVYRMLNNKIQNMDFKLLEYNYCLDIDGLGDIELLSVEFDFNWVERIMVWFSGYKDILIGATRWGQW